jgi:tetratricopeptide (TPR) repeat protein
MRRMVVLLLLAGCAQTGQERLTELTADGVHLYRQGAYRDARETFRAALALRPNDPDLLFDLARCEEKMGNQAEADKAYQECLRNAPNHPEARHAVVARLVATGQRDEASRQVSAWMRASPKLAAPYIEDGWLYAQDRDLDTAYKRYQQAAWIEPRNPRILAEMAEIQEKRELASYALVLYERSLEADPDQPLVKAKIKELQAKGVSRAHPD